MLDSRTEEKLVEFAARFSLDPLGFVEEFFPWGEGDLADSTGPKDWQRDFLAELGKHLQNPATRHQPFRYAVASGHGIGKSALVAMVTNWGLSTMADCKVVVTANTDTQLRTKTWPEITKWFRMAINRHWFNPTATAVASTNVQHERTWRADAITWSESNTEAFAGLHNKKRRIILIFDEASAIPDAIWEVAEGALTDEDTEIIWLAFGNPTKNIGRFRECFGKFKHRWHHRQIDSRTVEGTNKTEINQWIKDYGADSDFVKIRIKGEFPRSGVSQFIPSDIVEAARARDPEAFLSDPCIMGVDVARFGDDECVIVVRRGRDASSVAWICLREIDTMQLAARIIEWAKIHKPDAIMVDGGGPGGGVIDRLRMMKQPVMEVTFGASPDGAQETGDGAIVYANKRAEIWGRMKAWLKGGSIPDDPDLAAQLIGVEYGYRLIANKDAIQLESKKDMKKRGLSSPDRADALACTFAYTIQPSDHRPQMQNLPTHQIEYNPLARQAALQPNHSIDYNPLRK